jgi:hypothetical protein
VSLAGAGSANEDDIAFGVEEGDAAEFADLARVRAEIERLAAAKRERIMLRADLTLERLLNELSKIAFADIRKVVKWGTQVEVVDGKMTTEFMGQSASFGRRAPSRPLRRSTRPGARPEESRRPRPRRGKRRTAFWPSQEQRGEC